MLFDESLHHAVARDRRREIDEAIRYCEFDLPRHGLLARWRARRAERSAAPAPAARPARAPEVVPPIVGIRRTLPDMYR